MDTGIHHGTVEGNVEAADLFEGAYALYEKELKGKTFLGRAWENIVMFDEGGAFPTARYTVTFPKNVTVDTNNIYVKEESVAISSIRSEFNEADNSVTIIMNLGNWNDYKGFFALVAQERGKSGHKITVKIPYSVDEQTVLNDTDKTVIGKGYCYLYKTSGIQPGKIVDINTTETKTVLF